MTLPARLWLPLAAALAGLAGCAPPQSPAQQAAEAARVQTGPSISALQLGTPPAPGTPGLTGPEASAIWRRHLAQLASGRGGQASGGSQGGGAAGAAAAGGMASGAPGGGY